MHPMLNTAIKAARAAGKIIQYGARNLDRVLAQTKRPGDFVSDIDREAEATIVKILLDAYPDHGILAEEGTPAPRGNARATHVWHIDPLDGTTNFLHGVPQYAVSIALAVEGVVTQAVIYDCAKNDLFTASRGAGAFLNNRRIRVSGCSKLREALIGTGFPFLDGADFDTYLEQLRYLMPRCAGLRRAGAAALDLAWVAAGYYDGFWEMKLNPWDIAAGVLLVQEAGGLVTDFEGESRYFETGCIIAATPKILPELLKAVQRRG
ncbi:MAG: inositol monophosphatase [Casimicrobiaceae bacterium]|nr:inositol monophosphatase [Casimicrobiaceae bacterium]MCX8097826.1 inositol monophosphatase [Casimicrobiaceae bacterium]MDW8311384.1 inositol monophosphatase family protein [Burkholderiales bacterium]